MSDPFLGQILLFAGNFAPRGYALCEGQLLSISSNQSLFAILGTTYGGDGRTSFGLPDLRGRVPLSSGQGSGLSNRSLGSKSGSENVTLNSTQMPNHTHAEGTSTLTAKLRAHDATVADSRVPGAVNVLSRLPNVNYYSSSDANLVPINGPSISSTIGAEGGSQHHENRQPSLAINYIIALVGFFPPRN